MAKQFKPAPGLRERAGKWHYRFMVAGVPYSACSGLPATERNQSAALRKMAQARASVESGGQVDRLRPRRFSEAAEAFVMHKQGEHQDHPATARRIATSMVSLREYFGARMTHQITAGDVEAYKTWRRGNGIKEVTLRHDLHALSGLYKFARLNRWATANPLDGVAIPSDARAVRDHVLSDEEEAAFFAAAVQVWEPYADAARLILLTGIRPDECLSLRPGDVDLERGTLTVRKGKTDAASRTLRLVPEAEALLRRRIRAAVDGNLWPSERGKARLRFGSYHDRALALCGLDFVIYELRHTFASRMAAAGCPLATLAAILGHGSLRTVSRYVHPQQASLDAAMLEFGHRAITYGQRAKIGPSLSKAKTGQNGPKRKTATSADVTVSLTESIN